MATKITRNEINFKRKIVNIRIDVHKHSWRVTALIEGLIVVASDYMPNRSERCNTISILIKSAYQGVATDTSNLNIPGTYDSMHDVWQGRLDVSSSKS